MYKGQRQVGSGWVRLGRICSGRAEFGRVGFGRVELGLMGRVWSNLVKSVWVIHGLFRFG